MISTSPPFLLSAIGNAWRHQGAAGLIGAGPHAQHVGTRAVLGILRRVGDAELQESQFLSIPRDESLHSNIAVTEAVRAGMGSWIVVFVLVLAPDQPTKMAPAFGRAVRVGGKS